MFLVAPVTSTVSWTTVYCISALLLNSPLWEPSEMWMCWTVPLFNIKNVSLSLQQEGSGMNWICRSAPQHNAIHQFKNSNVLLINAWGLHLWPLWNYSEVIFTSRCTSFDFTLGKAETNVILMNANWINACPHFPRARPTLWLNAIKCRFFIRCVCRALEKRKVQT